MRKKTEENKKEIRYILSIDGGGMRGIVPAYIIDKMSEYLSSSGDNRPFYSHFDLIAGTSTGGLIALALTERSEDSGLKRENGENFSVNKEEIIRKGLFRRKKIISTYQGDIERLSDSKEIINLYKENGSRIFKKRYSGSGMMNFISKLSVVFEERYDASIFEEYLKEIYKDGELSSSRVPTMVVSFNIKNSHSYIFRSWDSHGAFTREAARATSAAPTYFSPFIYRERDTGHEYTLVDGGIIANNPSLLAYAEGRKLYPEADEFHILSLSTASPVYGYDPEEFRTNAEWAFPLISSYGSANVSHVDETLEQIKGVKAVRVWENVLKEKIKMDDASKESVKKLEEAAEEIWEMDKDKILSYLDEIKGEPVHQDSLSLVKREDPLLLE